ncbi:MAG: 50S ribosomal protein L2 [Candidatus Caldarchaeum sp.]|nr:50S ribosomal protein L2 [Candidatus Caldarchaeum sp.]
MGRNIRAQRIGRGSPRFVASNHRRFEVGYPSHLIGTKSLLTAVVSDIVHDPGRGAPVAVLRHDGTEFYVPAVEGMFVGQVIEMGESAKHSTGNIVPVGKLPEGTLVSVIERIPGDGGKLVRSSGGYGIVMAQVGEKTVIKLPSKKDIEVPSQSLAVVGVVAGGGRQEKPFLKAGAKHYLMKARHRYWPKSRGVAMVPAVHPFGGGSHKRIGRPETVKRTTPPGRKVGLIAARRSGRKKKA